MILEPTSSSRLCSRFQDPDVLGTIQKELRHGLLQLCQQLLAADDHLWRDWRHVAILADREITTGVQCLNDATKSINFNTVESQNLRSPMVEVKGQSGLITLKQYCIWSSIMWS